VSVEHREHARRWLDAWNAHDLDAILDCYAEDVDFAAPTVVRRFGRPDGRLTGRAELREHFGKGLAMAPGLRFTEVALLTGPGGYALLYRRENGNLVTDVVELDAERRAARVRAYYAAEQP
jgi:hypothetical protein